MAVEEADAGVEMILGAVSVRFSKLVQIGACDVSSEDQPR